VEARVAEWTAARSPHDVTELLQSVGVPAAPMVRPVELLADPQLASRGFWTPLLQPGVLEPLPAEARPFRSARVPDLPPAAAPFYGQHTRELCSRVLGLAADEVDALISQGVLDDLHEGTRARAAGLPAWVRHTAGVALP
jgi:crotonobetainyl-CoA:carnitine CoA-transferase CaiB-like acyl-CoA transferase